MSPGRRNEYDKKRNLEALFREQNWCEAILKSYSLVVDRKITWQEFASRCVAYRDPSPKDMPIKVKLATQEVDLQSAFRKPVQVPSASPPKDEPINSAYSKLEQANAELKASLKQQKNTYEGIIYQLELDLGKRKQECVQLKQ